MLKLSNTARLPTLANKCFIVGEAKRADVIWSEGDFLALCEHMLNDNPPEHFLSVWIDQVSGQARFAKAGRSYRADKRSSWAWTTITGKAKVQTSIGFYPSNAERKSRWAAIDFDAHNGEHEQARKRSLEAFSLLLQQPQLHLILCASGNGYHLFIYTREFYPVSQWILLLKQLCEWIGVPIADGTCEIFPNERAESQRNGKAIRAPGTLNPKTGTFSLIEAETVTPLLETLPRTWSLGVGKLNCALPRNSTEVSLHKRTDNYSLTHESPWTKHEVEKLLARYPIKQKGTRHGVLVKLVGELSYKFGRETARRIAEELYRLNEQNIGSSLDDHVSEFDAAWSGMRKAHVAELSPEERCAFDELETERQRDGFFIVRAWTGVAEHKTEKDFPISRASLADRLSMTGPGASKVILKLCEKVIAQTKPCVRHKQPARYRWLLPRGKASRCNQVHDSPATACNQGPPSDCNVIAAGAQLLNDVQKDIPQLPQVAGAFETE
jgi:hypothetical protein